MSWARLDDNFFVNPKACRAPLEALGVYALGLAYAAHNETDGFIPDHALHLVRATPEITDSLDRLGLWERDDAGPGGEPGFRVHDYLDFNPSHDELEKRRQEISAKRAAAGRRGAVARWGAKEKPSPEGMANPASEGGSMANGMANEQQQLSQTDSPVPIPTPKEKPSLTTNRSKSSNVSTPLSANGFRPEVYELCKLLADEIAANGSKRPDHTAKTWVKEADLLLRRDKRPLEEAKRLIRWCQADPFWKSNVLSMPKFRKQYDTLRLRAAEKQPVRGRHLEASRSSWASYAERQKEKQP